MKRTIYPSVALLLFATSASAQTRLFDLEHAGPSYGQSVAAIGDLDGDGRVEFAAAEPGFDAPGGGYAHGLTTVYGAASGESLFGFLGTSLSASGWALAAAGDVNNDGIPDIIVGSSPSFGGYASVHSGADGSVIHALTAISSYFGAAVSAAGDVNADGWDDFLVSDADFSTPFLTEVGVVYVYSGQTGTILRTIEGTASYEHFGSRLSPAGDLDQDGFDDFAVSAYNSHFGSAPGIVRVISGVDGGVLRTYSGGGGILDLGVQLIADEDFDGDGVDDVVASHRTGVRVYSGSTGALITDLPTGFNSSIALLDDLDGDSVLEVAVGAKFVGLWRGLVTVYSGASGSVAFTLAGNRDFDYFGGALASCDVDGDGVRDLVIGASPSATGQGPGHVYVHTVGARPLEADIFQISMASGGAQVFDLDAGPAMAGAIYQVVGSLSGISPGIPLPGGLVLPLNFDSYLLFTVNKPNGTIQGSLGVLDSSGTAQATINVPADPNLIGISGHHAFDVFQLAPLTFRATSNPVSLRLVP